MLKQTFPFVGIIRLSTGEEIIAKIISTTMATVVVQKPLQLVRNENGMSFMPISFLGDDEADVEINESNIVYRTKPMSEVKTRYESIISGIELPPEQGIIT